MLVVSNVKVQLGGSASREHSLAKLESKRDDKSALTDQPQHLRTSFMTVVPNISLPRFSRYKISDPQFQVLSFNSRSLVFVRLDQI